MLKICERCGKEFECLHSRDCWCVKLDIPEDLLKTLKREYKDCICKNCLEDLIASYNEVHKSNISDKM